MPISLMTGTGLQGGWWLRSPGNNDNNAAFVNGENGNVNENGNNVKKEFGVRPALPDCQKCMEGSMRQCIGQRNPVPFLRRHPREKHMLSDTLDARAFKALGVGDASFPRQPIGRTKTRRIMTDETEFESVNGSLTHHRTGDRVDGGHEHHSSGGE
jgi:hypothetical protein